VKRTRRTVALLAAAVALLAVGGALAPQAYASSTTFIGPLHHARIIASTKPANGDVNPYGVAVVPRSAGRLHQGDVLVSNFNDRANVQGTGTTIVQVSPAGKATLFAHVDDKACPGGVGLTTALVVLRSGWVVVGSLPTRKGSIDHPGCLIVLNQQGSVKETIVGHGIDGPWDMTALDQTSANSGYGGNGTAVLFVTNVLGGIRGPRNPDGGTVRRLLITSVSGKLPKLLASATIGSGFPARTDPAALVIGPTGVGLGRNGTLYVADTLDNRIAAIPDAASRHSNDSRGATLSKGGALHSELGLTVAPDGDVLTVNGGNGNMVEVTPQGKQAVVRTVDANSGGGGNLFGLAVKPGADAVYFVDDFGNDNNLQLLF
jgi:hypothetical protein